MTAIINRHIGDHFFPQHAGLTFGKQKISHMKINKTWHLKHPMPPNPTTDQRIEWHIAHQQNCSCRKIPGKLAEEMKKRGIKITT
ncbi:hypothetical protein [Chitinophaga sp. XS-30]|uniref:hypothetical protein n=1 Tax=Chitinophaga sp. XS-30 TaxID=2604421 RepID=UPI0011DD3072|nr:hypothetical protein [Chitinophaga sp. XS-30]QEH41454.1 hypothetical protein FW415_11395 [Chitinophaga sp. XS-30]